MSIADFRLQGRKEKSRMPISSIEHPAVGALAEVAKLRLR
jgi:hypothetical protein